MKHSGRLVGFVPTTDYKRAREFYVDRLGLEYVNEDQFAMMLKSKENMIRLWKTSKVTPAPSTVLGWEVEDVEKVVRELMSRGIVFQKYEWVKDPLGLGIWTTPNGDKVAWFTDPDGNVLSISQHVKS